MEAPTQEQILAAVKPGAVPQQLPVDVLDETEIEEEVIEPTEASDGGDTEDVESDGSDDDTPDEDGTEEPDDDDDEVYVEYVINGESLKVNLADPTDLAKVKKALELTGLEVKTQHAVEGRKNAERRADAAEIKLRELEAMKEARKPLEPYDRFIESPQGRQQLQRANPRMQLPNVEYSPEAAKVAAENARLKRQQLQNDNAQDLNDITIRVKTEHGLDDSQLQECVSYLQSEGLGYDVDRPVKEQGDNLVKLVGMARHALIGQGRLPNPDVVKAQAETAKATKKLKAAKKRRAARNPSAGTGATPAASGTPGVDLAGASIETVLAEYKKRSGK